MSVSPSSCRDAYKTLLLTAGLLLSADGTDPVAAEPPSPSGGRLTAGTASRDHSSAGPEQETGPNWTQST